MDEKAMTALVEQMAQTMKTTGGGQSKDILTSMKSVVRFRMLTEPDTLIPHSYTTVKEVTMAMAGEGGEKTSTNEETVTAIYSYPK